VKSNRASAAPVGGVADELVHADDAGLPFGAEFDEEHIATVDAGRVDVSIERHCHSRLDIEPIERVDERRVMAVRHVDPAIGEREIHSEAGSVPVVRSGERRTSTAFSEMC
jgi:hypothetical protein